VFTTRRPLLATAVTVALTGLAALGVATPASAATADIPVNICHATGSATNAYVAQTTTAAKIFAGRYADGDIIPTFTAPNADGLLITYWGHNTTSSTVSCDAVTAATDFIL
jgi:ABC-type sugar transport system substrate-binding protein